MNSLDFRPTVTFSGDSELFLNLQPDIATSLIAEKAEWRRSYGRPPKSVTLNARFAKLEDDHNEELVWIRDQRILHTYWTSCSDTELYKSSVKEEIQLWLNKVKAKESNDWMIVCFESLETAKKTTKLIPRTTVLERIKSELAGKHADRCLSVCEPSRSEGTKQPELWTNFMHKLRFFLMTSFNKMVIRFEEYGRSQREKRTEFSWDFRSYFLLQDELGLLFQSMGMPDEALLIYDELEVMFAQFIQDFNPKKCPKWIDSFKLSPRTWSGPQLTPPSLDTPGILKLDSVNLQHRSEIGSNTCSLLDFRNYLFAQQATILMSSFKAVDLAKRCLAVMQNCLAEVKLLGVEPTPGSIESWIVLTTLDGVKQCSKICPEMYAGELARYTAAMWDLAKTKLYELGVACGLHPKNIVESEHLHYVATLSSGFTTELSGSVATLQQALANTEQFRKLYLDFCEMAISAYKHVSLARSARMVGKTLAKFYEEIDEPQKAVQFLSDLLRSYEEDSWDFLLTEIQKDLVDLFRKTGENEKVVQVCAQLTESAKSVALQKQWFSFLLAEAGRLEQSVKTSDLLRDVSAKFGSNQLKIINKQTLKFEFVLTLNALIPEELCFDYLKVTLKKIADNHYFQGPPSAPETKSVLSCSASDRNFNLVTDLNIKELVSYKQDGTVSSVGVTCLNPQKLYIFPKSVSGEDEDFSMGKFEILNENIAVKKGRNEIIVQGDVTEKGSFMLSKVEFVKGRLIFQHRFADSKSNVISVSDDKLAILAKPKRKAGLLAGFLQEMSLVVHSGSFPFLEPFTLNLRSSHGMKLGYTPDKENLACELQVEFPALDALQSCERVLWVFTDIHNHKEVSIHHKLTVQVPQIESGTFTEIPVDFSLPFTANFKLHVVELSKFLNFNVHGLTPHEDQIELSEPSLILLPPGGDPLRPNFLNVGAEKLNIFHEFNAIYLWEMKEYPANVKSMKAEFTVKYKMHSDHKSVFKYTTDVSDFYTLLRLKAQVTPSKGAEYCRAGSVCSLVIIVEPYAIEGCALEAIMYEVLQEQNMWAVCGRTAGVLNLEGKSQQVTVEVMPLIGGYLPLPTIRLSKYIPSKSGDVGAQGLPRLEPFAPGQVYSASKSVQVHVLAASSLDQSLI